MDLYNTISYAISRHVTEGYSTSFSMSTQLFDESIRPDIYAIYGLVRIADEIVDTYRGADAGKLLERLESDAYAAIVRGYDTNPIVHAFARTAQKYSIGQELIHPFFMSMAMDLRPAKYTDTLYKAYIYGSAEVVGLMCLRVFSDNDSQLYDRLKSGAGSLGAAYQKINFLRDIAVDYKELGRLYFPGVTYESFDERAKLAIVTDVRADLKEARKSVVSLPMNSRRAVMLSVDYYDELLRKIEKTSAATLKQKRVRISDLRKLWLYAKVRLGVTG